MRLDHFLSLARRELRVAFRALRARPGFTAVAVLTLALGIGASTALFGALRAVLLRPLPYADGERIVHLRRPAGGLDSIDVRFAVPDVEDFRARQRSLAGLAEHHTMTFNLVSRGEPLRVRTSVVSADFFSVLGVRPVMGRAFRTGDDAPGADPVVVVSHGFWQSRLSGDPRAVGRTVEMTGRAHTVVGVLPPLPSFPDEAEVYLPTPSCPFRSHPDTRTSREARMVTLVGRLRPGATLAQAERELAGLNAAIAREHPEAYPAAVRVGLSLRTAREELSGGARLPLLVVAGAALCVLLIACANVANLLAVRLVGRERELAVRAALGAGRARLVGAVLAEGVVLAGAGAVLGIGLAVAGLGVLRAAVARATPLASEIRLDAGVLAFAAALALLVGVGVGAVAFFSLRAGGAGALASGAFAARGAAAAGPRRRRAQGTLVAAQVAATAVLLVGAGLMLRTLDRLYKVDPGFDTEQVLTMRLTPDGPRYREEAGRRQFHQALVARVASQSGVIAAAVAGTFPLNEEGSGLANFGIEGRPDANAASGRALPHAELHVITPGYLRALGIPLLRGRAFTDADDREDAQRVVMVNQSAARRYWGGADPVGARITFDGKHWVSVVGVVGDVRQNGLNRAAEEELYRPMGQAPITGGMLVVRTAGDPLRVATGARAAVAALDPLVPVDQVRTLASVRDASVAPWRLVATLLGVAAAMALVVAATGVGGSLAFAVGQRTTEFGVRMALGATPAQVRRHVIRQGVTLAGVGLAAGLAAAAANAHVMAEMLVGVTPGDVPTYAAVAAVLLAVAGVASYLPARRATRVAPATVLRAE